MLKKRFITALWLIPLTVAVVWFDKPLPWFTIFVAVWGGLAVLEFYRLVTASRITPLTYFGLTLTLLFILSRDTDLLSILRPHISPDLLTPLLLTSTVLLSLIWLLLCRQKENAFASWAWTMAGILYMGWLLSYLVALRGMDNGQNWVFFALATNSASDTAAFFTGRAIGRHRLAPHISPSKTWEGTIGGLLGAIIVGLFFILPTPLSLPFNWWQAILLGLLVSIFGQLGDLVESLFKRNMGVKDASQLLPGHGGILDRIDSVVFAGVVVYYYVVWAIL
ncbi:phosphatidate cytidylyltransferase [Chloroflexota bacterium]